MQDDTFFRFCNGFGRPWAPKRFFRSSLCDADHTTKLCVDEWDCVCSHLTIRDRRAFAATSTHARRLDRETWAAGRVAILPECVGWHDLCYVAHMPLEWIVSGGECMDVAVVDGEHNRGLSDVRLCVCVTARLAADAVRRRHANHYHGIDLWRMATCAQARLFTHRGTGDERGLIAAVAGLAHNRRVHEAAARRIRSRENFYISLDRLKGLCHTTQLTALVLEALPWQWLWQELRDVFPSCGE